MFFSCGDHEEDAGPVIAPVFNLETKETDNENEIFLIWQNPDSKNLKEVEIAWKVNLSDDSTEKITLPATASTKSTYLLKVKQYAEYKITMTACAASGARSIPVSVVGAPLKPEDFEDRSSYLLCADTLMTQLVDLYLTGQYDVWNSSYPNATGPYWDGAAAVWGQGAAYSSFVAMMEAVAKDPNLSAKYAKLEDRLLSSLDKFRNSHNGSRSEAYGTYLGETDERYYDDNEWIGIDMVNMYLLTGTQGYLDRAKIVWNFIMEGYDEIMGGGIYWKEGVDSKHTCSTAPAAVMAAKLYMATDEIQYLNAAKDLYAWCQDLLQDPADHLYWDNARLKDPNDPESEIVIAKEKYSYNSGQPIQAAILLYRITGDGKYLEDAKLTAESAYRKWFMDYYSPVLDEEFRILSPADGDGLWFHAVMFRGLAELNSVEPDLPYVDAMGKSLTNAWRSDARNRRNNLIGGDFRGGKQVDEWPLIQEAACVEMFARMAICEQNEGEIQN